jgi:hypothetical protein
MSDYNEMMLNKHLYQLDADSAKEEAIELLAEQMSCASSAAIAHVLAASNYEVSYKNRNNLINGNDEFNEMFYLIAEKLINSAG